MTTSVIGAVLVGVLIYGLSLGKDGRRLGRVWLRSGRFRGLLESLRMKAAVMRLRLSLSLRATKPLVIQTVMPTPVPILALPQGVSGLAVNLMFMDFWLRSARVESSAALARLWKIQFGGRSLS